ncbi:MAG TPA: PDZ domain-containing protein, partial [Woeseiaceae bacterium]|nr:PDZ domain-containing protein [Woeseiaceae bacterium]
RFGETGEGMPERGLESVAQGFTGLDLQEFFERYVRGTSELPLAKLLREFGIRMHLRPAENAEDAGGKPGSSDEPPPPWPGIVTAPRDGRNVVALVHADSPAEAAGISAGDELLALNGVRVMPANIDGRLREYHAGDKVSLTVFRNDELLRFQLRLVQPPEDTCWLDPDPDASAEAEQRQRAWLSAP